VMLKTVEVSGAVDGRISSVVSSISGVGIVVVMRGEGAAAVAGVSVVSE